MIGRPDASIDFEHEPVLKQAYLPRKFKIVIAIPPYNDVDVYAHDIGLIAISDRHGELQVVPPPGLRSTQYDKNACSE